MGQILKILHDLKPAMLMVVVQVVFAGLNVLYKLAANDGMNLRLIVAYRFLFATAFMVPLLSSGSLAQNMYIESLALTSATFVCAMVNLTPAVTFIIAITIGLEKLALRTMAGKAKVLGTAIGIGGAMILTFYKGFQFNISTHINLLPNGPHASNSSHATHHLLGALLAFVCCICYALWMNIQAKMGEKYPCYYSSKALISVIGTVQTVAFALCVERDMSQWKIGWDVRLLTVAYAGVFGMGLTFWFIAWCVGIKGPLYTSIFSPLVLVVVAIAGSLFLQEKLYLGSIIGAVLIVVGLYVVLWGKSKEKKKISQSITSPKNKAMELAVTSFDDNTSIISNYHIISVDGSPYSSSCSFMFQLSRFTAPMEIHVYLLLCLNSNKVIDTIHHVGEGVALNLKPMNHDVLKPSAGQTTFLSQAFNCNLKRRQPCENGLPMLESRLERDIKEKLLVSNRGRGRVFGYFEFTVITAVAGAIAVVADAIAAVVGNSDSDETAISRTKSRSRIVF
ncbi:hypothetical protein F3Y22_tig00112503pilonHSYRG00229 [Hibiscus syriacus]|uniref:EamA domain-containing protein n=1 Tax=Hibiscus syriacus TaxID=106335 RepID=A0A6A2XGI6_HIBSY|nr:hypothetical protein F3Y22_tig00112503pilonHSYRG00229 [Hibiscus syriacus]